MLVFQLQPAGRHWHCEARGFEPRTVHVTSVVDTVALGHGVSSTASVSPVEVFPNWLQTRADGINP